MYCPVCEYDLQKLSVTTTSGVIFDVDHCGRCGGTWFDPYEINRIPYHEVVRLAAVTVLPKKHVASPKVLHCPRDRRVMKNYYGQAVPAGVRLYWCKKCLGIWASQKALEDFKMHQEGSIMEYKEGERAFPAISVVFIPAMLTAFLFLLTFATVITLQEARENRIIAQQLISEVNVTKLSPTILSITFNTSKPVKSWISYGPNRLEMATRPVAKIFATRHAIVLVNLKPNIPFLYRITLEDQEARRFTTDLTPLANY